MRTRIFGERTDSTSYRWLDSKSPILCLWLACLFALAAISIATAQGTSGIAEVEFGGRTFNNVRPIRITGGTLVFSHENGAGSVPLDDLSLKTLQLIASENAAIRDNHEYVAARDSFLPAMSLKGTIYSGVRLQSVEGGVLRLSTDSGEISCNGNELAPEQLSAILRTLKEPPAEAPPLPAATGPSFGPGFGPDPGSAPEAGGMNPASPEGPRPGTMAYNPFAPPVGGAPVTLPPPPQYQNPFAGPPTTAMVVPPAPEPVPFSPLNSNEVPPVTDAPVDNPINEIPEDEATLLGTWRFHDGTVRTFTTEIPEELQHAVPLKGNGVNAEGYTDAYWSQPSHFESPDVPWHALQNQIYTLNFTEGVEYRNENGDPISGTVILSLRDPGYLVGKSENDEGDTPTIRARKVGFAPRERSLTSRPLSTNPDVSTPRAEVDRDYLRLIMAVSNPWTDDPSQAADCTHSPLQQIERRMGQFDGGLNPETRGLVAAIGKARERIAAAAANAANVQERLDANFNETRNQTSTYTGFDINGNMYSRTEVTGTTIGDALGHMFLSSAMRSAGEANVRSEREALAYDYWRTNLKMAELAPRMYGASPVRTRLVKVEVSEKGFTIENLSGHTLTDLTVRIDVYHFSMVPKRYGCRLYYSPELHAGEKRHASVNELQIDPEKRHPYEIEWRPDRGSAPPGTENHWLLSGGGICEMKVSAWAREASQIAESYRFPEASKRGAAYEATLIASVLANPSQDRYQLQLQRRFLELASKRILQLVPKNPELEVIAQGTLRRMGIPIPSVTEWGFETEPRISYPE